MPHGLAWVTSEVAAELPEDLACLVARTPAEFAEKLARVHEDEAFSQRLSEAGLAYIEQRHSAGVLKERRGRRRWGEVAGDVVSTSCSKL